MAEFLRGATVSTILGDLTWDDRGAPQGDFLIGQWQSGEVQFVLPTEFATSDKLIPGWMPGGAG